VVLGYPPMGSLWIWVCLPNKCELSNSYCPAMMLFGIKPWEKISNYFQFFLKCVSVLSNVDRNYYQCIPIKEVTVQPSKRKCTSVKPQALGSYKGEWHDRIAFFLSEKIFLYFDNILRPSQRTSRCRNWVTSPLAAKIYCCLKPCSFVFFMLNGPENW
jgi:hypothetical protein